MPTNGSQNARTVVQRSKSSTTSAKKQRVTEDRGHVVISFDQKPLAENFRTSGYDPKRFDSTKK